MRKTDLIQKLYQLQGLTAEERACLINLIQSQTKYGLVWENKPETAEEQLKTCRPVLTEVPDKTIINGNGCINHLLIEGDNLHALTALLDTHRGKIDIIYIDPPYNTGKSDFTYHDVFKDKSGWVDESTFRHNTWLSFMYRRLICARQLLSSRGVIFISIDDNECYQLKLLCDEIFGSDNFVANHVWKSKSGGAADASFIATDTENILLYAANKAELKIENDTGATISTLYNRTEPDGRRYALERLDKQNIRYCQTLDFTITGPDGARYQPKHKNPGRPNATWRWAKETVQQRFDELVFENGNIYTKNYEKEGCKPRNLLIEERFGRTRTGKKELSSIIGVNDFTAPKPSRLISYLVNLFSCKNCIVLDFFAGSGTTLHAVMALNKLDGGQRQCILCTNNENNICEKVTYPRVRNLIMGYQSQANTTNLLLYRELNVWELKKARQLLQQVSKIRRQYAGTYSIIKTAVKENALYVWGELKKGEWVAGLNNNNLRYYKTELVAKER
jgi:adenine-specific DNA-methyltransferase